MKSTHKTLNAYQKGLKLTIEIFKISRRFPPEERYELTKQILRSSRSVCANIADECGNLIGYMLKSPGKFGVITS